MKYIKFFENKSIKLDKLTDKLKEILYYVKKLDVEFDPIGFEESIVNYSSTSNQSILIYKRYVQSPELLRIKLEKHLGLNFKIDYIEMTCEVPIYRKNIKETTSYKLYEFFKNFFEKYLFVSEEDYIELRIPINNINDFYLELDDFYMIMNSDKYNL